MDFFRNLRYIGSQLTTFALIFHRSLWEIGYYFLSADKLFSYFSKVLKNTVMLSTEF